jgi:hypothetical protein
VDPSALIFVALAVAWAVYLIPKALEHHEESARTRTVERFSATLRVLARREPVNRRKARLVTPEAAATPERTSSRRTPAAPPLTVAQLRARRLAAARAAKRRLRVVALILVANLVVGALAYLTYVEPVWCAVPAGLLAVWLVACRLMVKRERADLSAARIPAEPAGPPKDGTEEIATVEASVADDRAGADASGPAPRDPDAWDPVYAPLPTYVSKPVARRSVSTIDLDSTGVWSSGRKASDSQLAREAEAVERPAAKDATERRASGA